MKLLIELQMKNLEVKEMKIDEILQVVDYVLAIAFMFYLAYGVHKMWEREKKLFDDILKDKN